MARTNYKASLVRLLEDALATGAYIKLKVISQSMSPTLQTGDIIKVQKIPLKQYHRGNLLVHIRKNELITHRLIVKKKQHWITKGDNSLNPDPPIHEKDILGRVCEIQRGDHIINLQTRYWQFLDSLFGSIGLLQVVLLKGGDKVFSTSFDNNKFHEQLSLAKRIVSYSFKLATKTLALIFIRRH